MAQGDIWPTPEIDTFAVTGTSDIFVLQDPKIILVYLYNLGGGTVFMQQGAPAELNKGIVIPTLSWAALSVDTPEFRWVGDTLNLIGTAAIDVSAYIARKG